MYLIVVEDFAILVRDLQKLFEALEKVFGGEVKVSVAPGGYVLQARQPEDLKARPVVANLGKQRAALSFLTLPTLPFRVPTVGFDE
jgi:hypothetical protein